MRSQPSDRHQQEAYGRARELRRPLTPTETILWKQLRGRRLAGYKFRRQQPIGRYIADFCCASANLIVELDGNSHAGTEAVHRDRARQTRLEAAGYVVLRFWNTDVYDDLNAVLEAIHAACVARSPASPLPTPTIEERAGHGKGKRGG